MAALEIQGNGDSGVLVTDEQIAKTIEGLENAQQKNFISKCLQLQPEDRASARELLFHPLLFEVHSLKLLAAHCLVNTAREYQNQEHTVIFDLYFHQNIYKLVRFEYFTHLE